MSELWSLPGYDVRSIVGDGRAGDLWSAVDVASGQPVVLRRVGGAADLGRLQSVALLHAPEQSTTRRPAAVVVHT